MEHPTPDLVYEAVQRDLTTAWRNDLPGSDRPRVIIGLPSFSLGPSLLTHYADRIPALEQRYLYCLLLLANPACRVVYLSSHPVPEYLVEYYLDLVPGLDREDARRRMLLVTVDDDSPVPLADKLLERPHLLDVVRDFVDDLPAMIEAWNVTGSERDLAVSLHLPVHGSHPRLLRYGTKSGSRRAFAAAGVPHPEGIEDITTPSDVVRAIMTLRRRDPRLKAVVVKLDDSAAGDGNAIIDLEGLPYPGTREEPHAVKRRLYALPGWYVTSLGAERGIVEAWIEGDDYRSPSVQLTVTPDGEVVVLSTHDQILGGLSHQVYEGCRFPADPEYAADLAEYGRRVGKELASAGVVGRFAVDFATVRERDGWTSYALEINLRKGGTTHPYGLTNQLLRGSYDADAGLYVDAHGERRYYVSTDNLIDPAWMQVPPPEVITRVAAAGLSWDPGRRTGVVVHMLECLPIDGRFGFTAIGRSRVEAQALYDGVEAAMR